MTIEQAQQLLDWVRGVGLIIAAIAPVLFSIAVSLHRIAGAAWARRDPRTGVLSRD